MKDASADGASFDRFMAAAGFELAMETEEEADKEKEKERAGLQLQRLHLLAVLWPETTAFHGVKAAVARRLIAAGNTPKPDANGLIPGFIHLLSALADQAEPVDPAVAAPLRLGVSGDAGGFGGLCRGGFPLQMGMPEPWGDWTIGEAAKRE